MRQLPPSTENIGRWVVKSPEGYVVDSGLLHAPFGIEKPTEPEFQFGPPAPRVDEVMLRAHRALTQCKYIVLTCIGMQLWWFT